MKQLENIKKLLKKQKELLNKIDASIKRSDKLFDRGKILRHEN